MGLGSAVALATERIVTPVEGMHRAIARPWLAALGPLGRPVQAAHNAVSRMVYGSIRLGAAAVGVGLDASESVDSELAPAALAFVNRVACSRRPLTASGVSVQGPDCTGALLRPSLRRPIGGLPVSRRRSVGGAPRGRAGAGRKRRGPANEQMRRELTLPLDLERITHLEAVHAL